MNTFLCLLLFFSIPILFLYFENRGWIHSWKYRNPHNRTCRVCRRFEVRHGHKMNDHGWWEVFDEGDREKHTVLRRLIRKKT